MLKRLVMGMALAVGLVSPTWAQDLTRGDYEADFAYLVKQLEARHPDPFIVLSKPEFEARLDALLDDVETQDAFTTMMDLRVLVAALGDSHTSVGFYDAIFERGAFPLEFAWFGDEIRVIGAEEAFVSLLGARLDAIDDTPFDEVAAGLASLVPPQDTGFMRKRIPWFMRYIGLHHYLGFAEGDAAVLSLTDAMGEGRKVRVPASVFGGVEGDLIYLSDRIDHPTWINFNEDRLDIMFRDRLYEDGIYLVQYNSAWGRELQERFRDPETADDYPSFETFAERVLATLRETDVKAMIFDVRANSGGSSPQGTRLAEQISALPEGQKPEAVYVAIGEQTFSAAIINAMNFKQMLDAEFIGTRSGGKANHFGEVRMFVLPRSGIELPHSTEYFKYVEGESGSLDPDIYAPARFEDFMAGRDAVVEEVRARLAR
ncbi:hypothetical protein [uncultured Algimonas sp.]|uniref:hypothetical protein n=1 Tax=uncultured Algimonas sp. TaxID=1547920 RepID=UPI002622F45E|nr:hypothetical protein [uncultured Algimonas sp.]